MVRTQVQLTEEQVRALKRRAAEEGVSIAALIRQAVEEKLSRSDQGWPRFWAAVGKFHSREGDLSERHDEYFAEEAER